MRTIELLNSGMHEIYDTCPCFVLARSIILPTREICGRKIELWQANDLATRLKCKSAACDLFLAVELMLSNCRTSTKTLLAWIPKRPLTLKDIPSHRPPVYDHLYIGVFPLIS
jgi:hypothetical protein